MSTPLSFAQYGPVGARPIVFLHGAGINSWMWDRQVTDLSEFRCTTIDLPGHGAADGASRALGWQSLDRTAALVAETVRAVVEVPTAIVGLSLGADVGLRLLASEPDQVSRAVLTGMVTRAVNPAVRWLQDAMAPLAGIRSLHRLAGRTAGLTDDRLDQWVADVPPLRVTDYRAITREIFAGVSLDGLDSVRVPTLAIAGAREARVVRESVELVAAAMPRATARIVPGVGHTWNVEAPELFAATVRGWLNEPE